MIMVCRVGVAVLIVLVSANDEMQLRQATAKVKSIIGETIDEATIKDTLWYYYFDVDQTVNYLSPRKGV